MVGIVYNYKQDSLVYTDAFATAGVICKGCLSNEELLFQQYMQECRFKGGVQCLKHFAWLFLIPGKEEIVQDTRVCGKHSQ